MKRLLSFLLIFAFIMTTVSFPLTVSAAEQNSAVYVSDSGSDSGDGTEQSPYLTLDKALSAVSDNGTVVISGTLTFGTGSAWSAHGKTVTITGGTFDISALSSFNMRDSVTWDNITIVSPSASVLYFFANGYDLTVNETVTITNPIRVYGASNGGVVESTNVKIYGGTYEFIFGGSNGNGKVTGDTNVLISGSAVTVSNVYGAGVVDTVEGSTNITLENGAKATSNIYGGAYATTATDGIVGKGTNITVINGSAYNIYGGGANALGAVSGGTRITILAGEFNTVFGGGSDNCVVNGDTHVHIEGGTFNAVYGGGASGSVLNGSTYVYVGGNANPGIESQILAHSQTNNIYGGGYNDSISGSTNLELSENALATLAFGGSNGASSTIGGGTNLVITGGKAMGFYGGSNGAGTGNTSIIMTGGEAQQVFGGCFGGSVTGNVDVQILGGKVTRRIYAGCYNEYASFSWQSSYTVTGNLKLTIGGNANITFDSKDSAGESHSDYSIFARSRYKTSSNESATIIFKDDSAYTKYNGKTGAQDFAAKIMMSQVAAADTFHAYSYAADSTTNTITETCRYCSDHSATAQLVLDGDEKLYFDGNEHTPADVIYSDNWENDRLELVYANNVYAGSATASIVANNGASVSLNFVINMSEVKGNSSELKFEGCNISLSDSIYIKYALSFGSIEDIDNIKLLIWTTPQAEYVAGTEDATLSSVGYITLNGKKCLVFDYKDVSAKEIVDVVYARAYIEIDGEAQYSDIKKYSVLKYIYNKLGYTGTATGNEAFADLLRGMLEYGASAQEYFNYNTDRLATDKYYQISVEGGCLQDGLDYEFYKEGDKVTLIAYSNKDGLSFSHWQDASGKVISSEIATEITVGEANAKYTAVYE